MKKRAYILALCIALCLTMTLAGTISYLSDTDGDVNVMTLGNVKIDLVELERKNGRLVNDEKDFGFSDMKEIYPIVGDVQAVDGYGLPTNPNFIDKVVLVESHSRNADAYLRVFIGVPSALRKVMVDETALQPLHLYMGSGITFDRNDPADAANWPWEYDKANSKHVEIDGVQYDMLCYNYNKLLTPGETTPVLLGGVYLDSAVDNSDEEWYTIWHEGLEYPLDMDMRNGIQLPVYVQAMQADGFNNRNMTFAQNRDYAFEEGGMNDVNFDKEIQLEVLDDGEGPDFPGGDFPGDDENTVTVNDPMNALRQLIQGSENEKFMRILLQEGNYNFASAEVAAFVNSIHAAGGLPNDPYQELIVDSGTKVEVDMGSTMMPEPARLVVNEGELILTADEFI